MADIREKTTFNFGGKFEFRSHLSYYNCIKTFFCRVKEFNSDFRKFLSHFIRVAAALIPRLHMREPQSYSICLQNFPACNLKVKPLSLH